MASGHPWLKQPIKVIDYGEHGTENMFKSLPLKILEPCLDHLTHAHNLERVVYTCLRWFLLCLCRRSSIPSSLLPPLGSLHKNQLFSPFWPHHTLHRPLFSGLSRCYNHTHPLDGTAQSSDPTPRAVVE